MDDSSLQDICRICHGIEDADSPFITPCYCSGTFRYVHNWCLEEWIKFSRTSCCEICKFNFIMHTKMKPLRMWKKLDIPDYEQPKVLRSILIHVGMIMWLVCAIYSQIVPSTGGNKWPLWLWVIVIIIVFIAELVYLCIHCNLFWRWCIFNRAIYVQNVPELGGMLHHQQQESRFSDVAKQTVKVWTVSESEWLSPDKDKLRNSQSESNIRNANENDVKTTFTKMPTDVTISFEGSLNPVTDNIIVPVANQNSRVSELIACPKH